MLSHSDKKQSRTDIRNNLPLINPEYPRQYVISEMGSSPAEYIIATLNSPISELNYELNSLNIMPGGDLQIRWKIHNLTGRKIYLSREMRKILSPTKLRAADYHTQYAFPIRYQAQIPVANCVLAEYIPPFGRVECAAVVGPQFAGQAGLSSSLVQVYLPGTKNGIRVFLNS
ncbi:MAG: hypothetical protein SFT81_01865 [Candidatus Caenarcaniphilales bacterium]|nr:hypothetical protein [Candidatus Caenarcaniphilales bacterium]